MNLPFFYTEHISSTTFTLDEDTSKHIAGVLRMTVGEEILLTDGKGAKARATIVDDNRKRCVVQVQSTDKEEETKPKVFIAVSVIKNASRFEWFLEKATEIGVAEIIPLLCERTEKEKFRFDRMQNILISAMLQSQQTWLPVLHQPTSFNEAVKSSSQKQKFIAHCLPEKKQQLVEAGSRLTIDDSRLILIGPEGDFTEKEIAFALQNDFVPVALGNTRLRTETAGIVAATLLRSCLRFQGKVLTSEINKGCA